ncbi:hypothetical protein ANCCEY_11665 [Ancylostoma ceylanicum]|uniref:Uncharacterized protein n=1 Tax=Ancylostoma ceylanicum TaxID=53326 RepID=A0A0D6LH28_9BILA|nr:hypothetical protein ANCCEY_11665 [Ancylostoma ceylanicum]
MLPDILAEENPDFMSSLKARVNLYQRITVLVDERPMPGYSALAGQLKPDLEMMAMCKVAIPGLKTGKEQTSEIKRGRDPIFNQWCSMNS